MPKEFGEFIKEQSIRLGSGKKSEFGRRGGHRDAESRTPHIPHPITTRPSMEEDWGAVKSFVKRGVRRAVFGRVLGDLIGAKSGKKKRTIPESRKLSTAERLARNLKRGGYDMAASEKKNKELDQRNAELRAKYADILRKEEAGPVSVGGGAGGAGGAVPSITDPTTNYAAQLKKKSNMLRRKKPQ